MKITSDYAKLCKKCTQKCKQASNWIIVRCPQYNETETVIDKIGNMLSRKGK